MLFSRHKTKMIAPAKALPGREQAAFKLPERHAPRATFPRGSEYRGLRPRLLLGRRAQVLADRWCLYDRRRLRRRLHTKPDLWGGVQRPNRTL